jgi:hypothetical protein
MAYGFVSAYLVSSLFAVSAAPSSQQTILGMSSLMAVAGMFGGILPDIDQLEFWGPSELRKYFVHKKTLHYISGYLAAAVVLLAAAVYLEGFRGWALALACLCVAAWLHSVMDILDGWRDDNPTQGIYEHLTRRWLPSLRLILFAGTYEWVIQALAAVFFIAISAHISQMVLPGWLVTTIAYFAIWFVSVAFDVFYRAPRRQPRELRSIRAFRGIRYGLVVLGSGFQMLGPQPPDVVGTILHHQ